MDTAGLRPSWPPASGRVLDNLKIMVYTIKLIAGAQLLVHRLSEKSKINKN